MLVLQCGGFLHRNHLLLRSRLPSLAFYSRNLQSAVEGLHFITLLPRRGKLRPTQAASLESAGPWGHCTLLPLFLFRQRPLC